MLELGWYLYYDDICGSAKKTLAYFVKEFK